MQIRKVMLVDDEADIRTIAEMSLQSVGGWEVVVASSGQEALELVKTNEVDLVLLDVMMPALDGPSTLARLQAGEKTASIPVIFMTAKVQKGEVARYMELGAKGVIAKPFDPMTLPDEIRGIVEGA